MPMRIRLAMHGVKNRRIFHLVAINGRARRDGKPTELLGIYNPHIEAGENQKKMEWSVNRIKYWLSVGAIPSKSALKLLELGNVIEPNSKFHPQSHQDRAAAASQSTPGTSSTPQPSLS